MSDELDRREPEGKIEKTTTRRDFLVGLKGAVLPSLAVLGLGALLQGCAGCPDCSDTCAGECRWGCKGLCKGCTGSCTGSCEGGCSYGCQGGCSGSCSGGFY